MFAGAKTGLIHEKYWEEIRTFGGPGSGSQKFSKFVTLAQFYTLSMFRCFIISDAYPFITCKLITLLWACLRCNDDPVCRNTNLRNFRIAIHLGTFHLSMTVSNKQNLTSCTELNPFSITYSNIWPVSSLENCCMTGNIRWGHARGLKLHDVEPPFAFDKLWSLLWNHVMEWTFYGPSKYFREHTLHQLSSILSLSKFLKICSYFVFHDAS